MCVLFILFYYFIFFFALKQKIGTVDGGPRYMWFTPHGNDFTRWAIGSEKYSTAIEAFVDNRPGNGWLLGPGRSWHVVSDGQWKVDDNLYAQCTNDNSNNINQNQNQQKS